MKRKEVVKFLIDIVNSLNFDCREEIDNIHYYDAKTGILILSPVEIQKIQYKTGGVLDVRDRREDDREDCTGPYYDFDG